MKTEFTKQEGTKPEDKRTVGDIFAQNPEVAGHLESFTEFALGSLRDDPDFMPMMHCFTEKNEMIVIACPWENERAKVDFFTRTGPMLLKYHNVKTFLFASEVWMKKCNEDNFEEQKGKSLEHDDDATDALMCIYVADNFVMSNVMPVNLVKDTEGKVTKAIVQEGDWSVNDFEGRIPNMLKISKDIHPTMAKMFVKLMGPKNKEGLCFTAEDRAEITSYIGEMAEEGKLPPGIFKAMSELEKKVIEEQADNA